MKLVPRHLLCYEPLIFCKYSRTDGWKLSPLYDVNSSSDNKNALSTFLTETDNSQNIELALSVREYFDLETSDAKQIGLNKSEIDKMENVFRV